MMYRRNLVLSILLWIVVAGTAFAGDVGRTPRDTLIVASDLNPIRNLSPGATYVRNALMQMNNLYDRLIVSPEEQCNRRGIAESYRISDDGMEYVFKLRGGLRFHSGNPVQADDVAFSLRRVAKMGRAMTRFTTALGLTADNADSNVIATGPLEVTLLLTEPLAPDFVLNVLASPVSFVVDRETVMKHERDGDLGYQWLSRNSAGSGPFYLKEWEPRQWLIMDANEYYAGITRALDRVIVRDVQEPTLRRLLVSKGDVDIATDLSADQLAALKDDRAITISSRPAARLIYLAMNQANPALRIPQVRRAINLLIDRRRIADTMLSGTYRAHQGFWPNGLWAALEEPVYEFDPERARQLLAEAGFPSGLDMQLDVSTLYPYPQIAQSMQAMLATGEVDLELVFSDDAQNLTKMMNRRYAGLIMRSFNVLYPDPHDAVEWLLMNNDNEDTASVRNAAWRARYVNEALMGQAMKALHTRDADRRRTLYLDLQRALQSDGAISILFQQIHGVAVRKGVSGYCQGTLLDQLNYGSVVKH